MIKRLGDRLPKFTEEEQAMLLGSADFFGLNHYSTMYVSDATGNVKQSSVYDNAGLSEDQDINVSSDPSWEKTAMNWNIAPWGCRKLLEWIHERYQGPAIVITENGCAFDDKVVDGAVNDERRLNYVKTYLEECHKAIANGVQLKGYFLWSFMDNFEWASGYEKRFGTHYVDFDTMERIPKASAKWYTEVIKENGF